jgi:hypothetical protein
VALQLRCAVPKPDLRPNIRIAVWESSFELDLLAINLPTEPDLRNAVFESVDVQLWRST